MILRPLRSPQRWGLIVPWYAPLVSALRAAIFLAAHVLLAATLIGAIWVIQWLLADAGDPKLFDWIPIRYMFDVMDAGILAVFIWFGVKGAIEVFREGKGGGHGG
jgi:hypothetical protein